MWFYRSRARMEEILGRMLGDLGDRVGGPMTFRFVLQPTVAVFLGVRDGLRLGRTRTPLLRWGKPRKPGTERGLIRMIWRSVRVLLLVALLLDFTYQAVVQSSFYPGEAVIVSFGIALVPYLVVCAVVSACACYRAPVIQR